MRKEALRAKISLTFLITLISLTSPITFTYLTYLASLITLTYLISLIPTISFTFLAILQDKVHSRFVFSSPVVIYKLITIGKPFTSTEFITHMILNTIRFSSTK